jgi:hypothetical protein
MGESNWLEQGHGRGDGLHQMIKASSRDAADRVSIRHVLRGAESAAPRKSRRRTRALAAWLIYCCVAVGGTAAAFTVRDTLFPAIGAPIDQPLWVSSKPASTDEHASTPTSLNSTTPVAVALGENELGATTVVGTQASVEDQTVPSASTPNQGPNNSVDNHGAGGVAPATGTTLADDSSKGPGPGITIVDNPTESSTPPSASTPPASADQTSTSASTPDPGDHQRGKGGGGGGGGDAPTP